MQVLIVGCGWVASYIGSRLASDGHSVWGTTTTGDKIDKLAGSGIHATVLNFDDDGSTQVPDKFFGVFFDVIIVSVPITRKDDEPTIRQRFNNLVAFLTQLHHGQLIFFGSVGIYPKKDGVFEEDSFPDADLDARLSIGEGAIRRANADAVILRLGGLFGFERVMAKYFQNKDCQIGYQTANFVHIEDIDGIVHKLISARITGETYNVVSPEHPLKIDVVKTSAAKYGYELPSSFDDRDKTAKIVSADKLIGELGYSFIYPSPLDF